MQPHVEIVPWFFLTWIALGIFGIWLSFITKNIELKKKLFPVMNWGSGGLFVGFILFMTGEPRILLLVCPAVVVIGIINHHVIKVCESCGRTIINKVWFSRREYCSKCGAKL